VKEEEMREKKGGETYHTPPRESSNSISSYARLTREGRRASRISRELKAEHSHSSPPRRGGAGANTVEI